MLKYFYSAFLLALLGVVFIIQVNLSLPILEFVDEKIYFRIVPSFLDLFNYQFTFGHPPLMLIIVNCLQDIFTTRIFFIFVGLSLSFFSFWGFKDLLGPRNAFLTAVALILCPVLFTHIRFIIPNFLLSLFMLAAIWARLKDFRLLYFSLLALSLMTRESALAALVAGFITDTKRKNDRKYYLGLIILFILHFFAVKLFRDTWILNKGYLAYLKKGHEVEFLRTLKNTLYLFGAALPFGLLLLLSPLISRKLPNKVFAIVFLISGPVLLATNPNTIYLGSYIYEGWLIFPYWQVWLGLLLLFSGICSFLPAAKGSPFSAQEKELLYFSLFTSLQFMLFFSLYGDTYIRDTFAYIPFILLTVGLLMRRLWGHHGLSLFLIFTITCSAFSLTSPLSFKYPLNLFSQSNLNISEPIDFAR